LLGGDRVITAAEPFSLQLIDIAKQEKLQYTEIISFYSMLSTKDEFLLAAVKAVGDNYPLIGKLKASKQLNTPGIAILKPPEPGTLWLESRAVIQLRANIGDNIQVGDAELKLTSILTSEPDRVADGFTFAPRALINIQDVAKTKAIVPGGRVNYKMLITGAQQNLHNFDSAIKKQPLDKYKIQTIKSESNSIKNLNLATKYLNLALLVNIVLSAITVSICANRYSTTHTIDAAILRCLGASKKQIVFIYCGSLVLISLLIGLVGSGIGYIIEICIANFLHDYINLELASPGLWPLLLGTGCALFLTLIFGLPAIFYLANTPPMQILHRASTDTKNTSWRLHFKLSNKIPAFIRLSLNNIAYNSQDNFLQLLAFITVICVGLILFIVRNDLIHSWQQQLPTNVPNYFVINIPQERVTEFSTLLQQHKIAASELYPIVRGNLIKINGQEVSEDEEDGKRTGIHRPLNITWTSNLPTENQVVQGSWFTKAEHGQPLASIEKEMADRLRIKVGDEVTFRIISDNITTKITNIRTVVWSSFTPNFYLIYNPGVLNNFPVTYMSSFYLSSTQEQLLLTIVSQFPEVNLINISAMIDQAKTVLSLLSLVISFIWLFTLIIAILMLLAVVISSLKMRTYQNNLMRIIGASRKQLLTIFMFEFCILGFIAGSIGSTIAIVVAKQLSWQYFTMYYPLNWMLILYGTISGIAIMLISGLIGASRTFKYSPIQVGRDLS